MGYVFVPPAINERVVIVAHRSDVMETSNAENTVVSVESVVERYIGREP